MKKEIAIFLMLVFVVLAVSLVLVKFVKVVHARTSNGCCQASTYCYDAFGGGACMEGDTYHAGWHCCDDNLCHSACVTTTSTTTTVSTTTTIPEHGQVCDHTITPSCDPNKPLDCMSGGCNGEWVCCYNGQGSTDQEYAYCDDPPGGVAVSYCAKSKGTDPRCTYCKDLNGDHYNVGDCVTTDPSVCSSGWMICTDTCDEDSGVYEWGCEDHPEQNCPNYGGSGSTTTTSSTSTTTIPYDVLSVSYASLHNGANPA